MPTRDPTIDLLDHANRNAREYEGVSGFAENFDAAAELIINEELPIVSQYIWDGPKRIRNEKVKRLREQGLIPESIFEAYYTGNPFIDKYNYDGIARWANENLDLSVTGRLPVDEDIERARNEILAEQRAEAQKVFERQDAIGLAGEFAGYAITSTALDPIAAGTMLISAPVAGAYGLSRAAYTLTMARRTAMLGAASAAASEPFIHSWKGEIDSEYTLEQSLFNVAASGILSGIMGGGAAYISKYLGDKGLISGAVGVEIKSAYDLFWTDPRKAREDLIKAGLDSEVVDAIETIAEAEKEFQRLQKDSGGVDPTDPETTFVQLEERQRVLDGYRPEGDAGRFGQMTEEEYLKYVDDLMTPVSAEGRVDAEGNPIELTEAEKQRNAIIERQMSRMVYDDEGNLKPLREVLEESQEQKEKLIAQLECIRKS